MVPRSSLFALSTLFFGMLGACGPVDATRELSHGSGPADANSTDAGSDDVGQVAADAAGNLGISGPQQAHIVIDQTLAGKAVASYPDSQILLYLPYDSSGLLWYAKPTALGSVEQSAPLLARGLQLISWNPRNLATEEFAEGTYVLDLFRGQSEDLSMAVSTFRVTIIISLHPETVPGVVPSISGA